MASHIKMDWCVSMPMSSGLEEMIGTQPFHSRLDSSGTLHLRSCRRGISLELSDAMCPPDDPPNNLGVLWIAQIADRDR